ncbi:hypothetical protein [Leptospira sarikeiensis]|uniref:Uncharacterized protein n=1 Tax=Leptospira sarikeiensis TaxID=2484943 RepID=A0A4R9KB54_9LEPT|nr:hypothetical protein [Leptospira sarikeiensis]TGL62044.1 hypothetical protein EHQ64_08870 [Leptospira sarikeiensis]
MKGKFPSINRIFLYSKLFLLPSGLMYAQQDIFNIPDLKITGKDRQFLQEQLIFYSNKTQFDTTFMYGLGDNEEIGVYAGNYFLNNPNSEVRAYSIQDSLRSNPEVNPNLLFIYHKKFEPTESISLSVGTKSGLSTGNSLAESNFASFNFGMSSYELKSLGAKFYLGAYAGNSAFFGRYRQKLAPSPEPGIHLTGLMFGLSVEIIPDRIDFLCDSITGVNSLGVSVCGFSYNFNRDYSISFGYQIPNPGGSNFNPHAFLIEINGYF